MADRLTPVPKSRVRLPVGPLSNCPIEHAIALPLAIDTDHWLTAAPREPLQCSLKHFSVGRGPRRVFGPNRTALGMGLPAFGQRRSICPIDPAGEALREFSVAGSGLRHSLSV